MTNLDTEEAINWPLPELASNYYLSHYQTPSGSMFLLFSHVNINGILLLLKQNNISISIVVSCSDSTLNNGVAQILKKERKEGVFETSVTYI
jgi:hypothetical protein